MTTSKYNHDDNLQTDYFVVSNEKTKKIVCSSVAKASRNDSVFVKGEYIIKKGKLVFTERHFFGYSALDSIKKTFKPKNNGTLVLVNVSQFKRGKLVSVD